MNKKQILSFILAAFFSASIGIYLNFEVESVISFFKLTGIFSTFYIILLVLTKSFPKL